MSPCPSRHCPIHGTPGAGTPPHHCWARAAPGALPPLPVGCGSATEAKAALINYELKHFPSWLFTRAASLLIRNNTKEGAFKAHLFRGTLIRCQLGAPQCAPGGLGLWLRGQTPLQTPLPTPNHSAPNYVRCRKASAITPGSSLQACRGCSFRLVSRCSQGRCSRSSALCGGHGRCHHPQGHLTRFPALYLGLQLAAGQAPMSWCLLLGCTAQELFGCRGSNTKPRAL